MTLRIPNTGLIIFCPRTVPYSSVPILLYAEIFSAVGAIAEEVRVLIIQNVMLESMLRCMDRIC